MINKRFLNFIAALSISISTLAQDSTDLSEIITTGTVRKEYVKSAFKSTRVINGHSMEFLSPGTMDVRILHRFGTLDNGMKNFFGLDEASMRLGFDFGIQRNLMIGVGRSTLNKELDGFIKYAPLSQSTGPHSSPITLAFVVGMTANTLEWPDSSKAGDFENRLGYYYQAIIGRKFSNTITLQVTPTWVHTNYPAEGTPIDQYAVGMGGRFKFSKRMALTLDYFYRVNDRGGEKYDPLSVGIDIETGGHVFQLHFSNAVGMNERAFINETTDSWGKGEVRFGFNLSRIFQLKPVRANELGLSR
ncbi:MAG TPA: DUF5777 family beta-barrel protein [Flavitalea sp.]|nr:DUF5777 family beta-barrel protein [Flavitalea sp.]